MVMDRILRGHESMSASMDKLNCMKVGEIQAIVE